MIVTIFLFFHINDYHHTRNKPLKRIHSSRMRTAGLMTVSRNIPCVSEETLPTPPPPDGDHPDADHLEADIPPDADPPGDRPPGCRSPLDADPHAWWEANPLPLCTEWHTGVKTLSCPKIRLRAVKMEAKLNQFNPINNRTSWINNNKSVFKCSFNL